MPKPSTIHAVSGSDYAVVPTADQTTVRLSKTLHAKLRIIASLERIPLMELTQRALGNFVKQYEVMSGMQIDADPAEHGSALRRVLR